MKTQLWSFLRRNLFTLLALAGLGGYVFVAGTTGSCPACAVVTNTLGLGTPEATPLAAPVWSVQTLDGQTLSNENLRGKVVLVDFWATWCPSCRKQISGLAQLSETYGPDGLVVVGLSLDKSGPETVRRFAEAHGIPYPLAMADSAIAAAFGGIKSIPTAFLLDRDGAIVFQHVGYAGPETLERALRDIL